MIKGGVKFFKENFALFRNGTTATASSNEDGVNSILDTSIYTQWESLGSNDLTSETITATLKIAKFINRILITRMNLKEFSIKYHDGATFVNFTNVIGVNSVSTSGINETAYARNTAYYEFDAVTTNMIQITCLKTQVVDAEKFINSLIVTEEIGTFQFFPRIKPTMSRNETKAKTLSRKFVIQKTYETNSIKITFKTHPSQNDLDIVETLFDREEPFLVYLCGGRTGTQFFKLDQKSWNLEDIFNMQIIGKLKNEWERGVYTLGFNKRITFEEHV